jgi:hypothetical protein
MRQLASRLFAFAIALLAPGAAWGVDVIAPLAPQRAPVGVLFEPTDLAVEVAVVDQRPDGHLIGGGVMGPGVEKGNGVYLIYATKTAGETAAHFQNAAENAVTVMGFKLGKGGLKLDMAIEELWVDMYRMSGFGPMNCIAYGKLKTTLSGADLAEPKVSERTVTYWETSAPVMSMKEIVEKGVSEIYAEAAWQAVATALLDLRPLVPNADQFAKAAEQTAFAKDEKQSRQAIFWLGIARHPESPVKEKLLALLTQSQEQHQHQAAAEALGMLGVQEAAPEMIAILGGKKMGGWDNTDAEHVWYLLHGLALLGEADLRSKLPATAAKELKPMSKLDDLVAFHAGKPAPSMLPEAAEKLAKAKQKLASKVK